METGEALLRLAELTKCVADNNKLLQEENEQLKAKLEKAKDALRFYGSAANYERDFGDDSKIESDVGHRARTTLGEIDETND